MQALKDVHMIMELEKKKTSIWMFLKTCFGKLIFLRLVSPKRTGPKYSRYNWWLCRVCYIVIHVPFFKNFILLLIVMNTLILATDRYPTPEFDLIKDTHKIFTILFSLECVIKFIGLRWAEWKKDKFNLFDAIIVMASFVEMLADPKSGGIISCLRAFRLLRLIKLARSNVTLRSLMDSIIFTIKAILSFMFVLAIFIYVFALLGMETFAGRFKFDKDGLYDPDNGEVPRQNFDSLLWSLVTVF